MAPEARIVLSAAAELDGDDVLVSPVVNTARLLIDGFPVNLHGVLPVLLRCTSSCVHTNPAERRALECQPYPSYFFTASTGGYSASEGTLPTSQRLSWPLLDGVSRGSRTDCASTLKTVKFGPASCQASDSLGPAASGCNTCSITVLSQWQQMSGDLHSGTSVGRLSAAGRGPWPVGRLGPGVRGGRR